MQLVRECTFYYKCSANGTIINGNCKINKSKVCHELAVSQMSNIETVVMRPIWQKMIAIERLILHIKLVLYLYYVSLQPQVS